MERERNWRDKRHIREIEIRSQEASLASEVFYCF